MLIHRQCELYVMKWVQPFHPGLLKYPYWEHAGGPRLTVADILYLHCAVLSRDWPKSNSLAGNSPYAPLRMPHAPSCRGGRTTPGLASEHQL